MERNLELKLMVVQELVLGGFPPDEAEQYVDEMDDDSFDYAADRTLRDRLDSNAFDLRSRRYR